MILFCVFRTYVEKPCNPSMMLRSPCRWNIAAVSPSLVGSLISPMMIIFVPASFQPTMAASRSFRSFSIGSVVSFWSRSTAFCCWYTDAAPRWLRTGWYTVSTTVSHCAPLNVVHAHLPRLASSDLVSFIFAVSLPMVTIPVPPHCDFLCSGSSLFQARTVRSFWNCPRDRSLHLDPASMSDHLMPTSFIPHMSISVCRIHSKRCICFG